MNITNFEMAQASTEIICGLTFVMAAVIVLTYRFKSENRNIFLSAFAVAAVMFISEAMAYIFRGNTDTLSLYMTRVCNFVVFACNLMLIYVFVRYIYGIIKEQGVSISQIYKNIVNVMLVIAAAVLIVNIFSGFMYYFDDANYYHRNTGWYIYMFFSLTAVLTGGITGIINRKYIPRIQMNSIIVFTVVPFFAIIFQTFVYGASIVSFSIALSVWLLFGTYLFTVVKNSNDENMPNEKHRTYIPIIILFVCMLVIMSASIVSCIISINRMSDKSSEENSLVISHLINDNIQNRFIRPITVSETMSKDYELINFMKSSAAGDAEGVSGDMSNYLDSIRSGFDYQMVFAVCDKSRAYYTYDGISKYVHPETDSHDIWYKYFVDSGNDYDLDVDTDEANNWSLSVFVNYGVHDTDGSFLGVCGVAVKMNDLCAHIADLENKYNVKINLVDKDGLIQIDSDSKRIERDTVDNSYFDLVNSKEFYYEKNQNFCRMTKYMKDLDWYLIVEDRQPVKSNVMVIILPIVFIFLIGLIMMTIIFGIITFKERRAIDELIEKRKVSLTDKLTGLQNRRAYDEMIVKIQNEHSESKYSIIMMDMNNLKKINDENGHNAGDELIILSANCMSIAFSNFGRIYRIGGDEFVAFLQCQKDELDEALNTFNHLMEKSRGATGEYASVSKGIVIASENEGMTFGEMLEKADRLMYEDKDRYYELTGKTRRH